MINRRHIRIKVMQSVYAFLQSKNENLVKEEKFLYFGIDKLYELYILQISLLVEAQKLAETRFSISSKNKVTIVDKLQGTKNFVSNKFIFLLSKSDSLNQYITDRGIDAWRDATEYLQVILKEIEGSSIFENYDKLKNPTFKDDKNFVISIFKELVAPNDKLFDYYESQYIGWVDDIPFVNTSILKAFSGIKETTVFVLENLYKDEDDRNFVKELFQKVVLLHTDYDKEIDEKTPNWDYDRIAGIDLILIKMAITEFLHFPSIPTRVSINEYLEIAKDYSSDKSSFFINGVLDKMEKEYQKAGKIEKIGRGLI